MDKTTAVHWLSPGEAEPSSTLKPEAAPEAHVTDLLGRLDALGAVQIGETLGTGGAGVVREATQARLQRSVAAKQLKHPDSASARSMLLQEALVLGQLEHPNIVPVHDVVFDAEGQLTLLMKRIDGDPWTRWLDDPQGLEQTLGVTDPLAFHLRVLAQVCDAVAFAHSRGVLHRDLKPDNVMIGAFGEVMVVDWGIAAGLTETAPAPRPRARQIAGTPRYMAPEMWSRPEAVSEATDTYLLGGILHRILTGHAPHHRRSDEAHAEGWHPTWPDTVPAELARIAQTALHTDPAQRFASVTALRQALDTYDAHRGAAALAAEARQRMADFDSDPEIRFQEARFAFQASLQQWPDNKDAIDGLDDACSRMARHHLAQDDPRSARRVLQERSVPDAPLEAEVSAAVAELEAVEQRARQFDPSVGASNRAKFGLLMAAIWAAIPLLGHFASSGRPPTRGVVYGGAGALFVVTAAALTALRSTLAASSLSRQLFGWIIATPLLQAVMSAGLDLYGVPIPGILNAQFFLWGTMCTTSSFAVDRRLALPGVAYLVAYFFAMRFPEQRYLVMFLPNLLLAVTTLVIYRQRG